MLHVPPRFSRRIHAWIASACLFILAADSAAAQDPAKVRVLVATKDTQQTLQVDFITKGAVARGLFVPFGGIGNAIAFDARSKEYSANIGPFDRRHTLVAQPRETAMGRDSRHSYRRGRQHSHPPGKDGSGRNRPPLPRVGLFSHRSAELQPATAQPNFSNTPP